MKVFYGLLVLLLFAIACEPEDMMSDSTAPVLEIEDPTDTVTVLSGESIFIRGTVRDNLSIDEITFISLSLGLNDTIPGSDFPEITGGIISINVETDEITPAGFYNIEIKASDLAGNEAIKDIPVVVEN